MRKFKRKEGKRIHCLKMCQENEFCDPLVLVARIFSGLGNRLFQWYVHLDDSMAFVGDSLEHLFLAA